MRLFARFGLPDGEALRFPILYRGVVDAPVCIGGPCRTVFELVSAVADLAVAVPPDMDGGLVRDPAAALPA